MKGAVIDGPLFGKNLDFGRDEYLHPLYPRRAVIAPPDKLEWKDGVNYITYYYRNGVWTIKRSKR